MRVRSTGRSWLGRRGGATFAALAAAVVASSTPHVAAQVEGRDYSDAVPAVLMPTAEAQRFRAELYLPADRATIDRLSAQLARRQADVVYEGGVAMTSAEQESVDQREEAGLELARIAREHFKGTAELGGIYIDHATGTTVVLATARVAEHERAIRAKARPEHAERLRTRSVRFGIGYLDDLSMQIADDGRSLAAAGAPITLTTVVERDNVVEVALAHDTPAARAIVASRYPAAALRFTGPVRTTLHGTQQLDSPPLGGGQMINAQNGLGTSSCTSGYVTYYRRRTDAALYVNDYYLVTAGHCDPFRLTWRQANSYLIGQQNLNTNVDGSTADAMRFPIPEYVGNIPGGQKNVSNYVAITDTSHRLMYYRETLDSDVIGQRTCVSGAFSGGERCGTLLSKTVNVPTGSGVTALKKQRLASFTSVPGDSGGSVLYGSTAQGINVGNAVMSDGTVRGYFSHIHEALYRLGQTDIYKG